MTRVEKQSNAEFKAFQREMKRQIAESGLSEDEFVERWLDTPAGQRFMAMMSAATRNSSAAVSSNESVGLPMSTATGRRKAIEAALDLSERNSAELRETKICQTCRRSLPGRRPEERWCSDACRRISRARW